MQLKILRTWIATTYFLDFKILLESNHQIHDFLANPREDCKILEEIFSAKHCSHTAKVLSGNSQKRIQRNLLLREDLHSLRVS
jgi:hypothetical protein